MPVAVPRLRQNVLDLEAACPDLIAAPRRVDKLPVSEQAAALQALAKALEGGPDQATIQELYCFVRFFATLSAKTKPRVLDLLCSLVSKPPELNPDLDKDQALSLWKLVVYFFAYLIVTCEREREEKPAAGGGKGKKKDEAAPAVEDIDWSAYRERCLRALLESLVTKRDKERKWADLGNVWPLGMPDEDFLSIYFQVGEAVLERPVKGASRDLVLELIAAPTNRFHAIVCHSVASALSHLVREHEHATAPVVDVLVLLASSAEEGGYGDDRLARELVLEVGNAADIGGAAASLKNVAGFIEELAKRLPSLLLVNLSVVLPHLNGESYQMRCSIIRSLASLVICLKSGSDKTRDKLLDILAERVHDVSSYGRGAALQAWSDVITAQALPLTHIHLATDVAVERVNDKSAIVRKQALALLTTLVERNPYNDQLTAEFYANKVAEVQTWLQENGYDGDGGLDLDEEEGDEEPDAEKASENGEDEPSAAKANSNDEDDGPVPNDADNETPEARTLRGKLEFLKYCKSALLFIARVERACVDLCNLLLSKTLSDVQGALRFFATAHEFGLPGAELGVRRMLCLVWDTRDSGAVKKELIETFERLYLAKATEDGKKRYALPPLQVATNLVKLARSSELDELTSLEQVVAETMHGEATSCVKRRVLPSTVIDALFQLAEAAPPEEARVALCVLGMAAAAAPQVVDRPPGSQRLFQIGFGGAVHQRGDLEMPRYACHALLAAAMARGGSTGLDLEDRIKLQEAAVELVCSPPAVDHNEEAWFPACQEALNLLALVSDDPTVAFETCVKRMGPRATTAEGAARLFFVMGQVAIKVLVLAEQFASRIKRARAGVSDKTVKKVDNGADEDLVGATAEEESEDLLLRRITEAEVVLDTDGLLGMHTPLLLKVLTDANAPPLLRSSAVLCLSKFMVVSEPLCERHLPLLLTVLRDAPEPSVRANIVIALGDLALRFPNSVEPFTAQVYRPLRDPTPSVRKNTLMVLTHLVLNDMIKIRGEVSEIALRLEDEDARVQDLARLFFTELAKRGTNPIYNLLPDVLGGLSREDASVLGPVRFRTVAKYLLAFVDKEKQCESIADKLCQRIHGAAGFPGEGDVVVASQLPAIQQCRDLAFCLEHLLVGDTLARRMTDDLFKLYRALLGDNEVYMSISRMGPKMKAAAKTADAKRAVDEWCSKIENLHASQSEEATTVERARGRKKKSAEGAENQLPKARKPRKPKANDSDDDNDDDGDDLEDEGQSANVPASKPAKARTASRKAPVDDEEETGHAPAPAPKKAPTKKTAAPKARGKRKANKDSDDEQEDANGGEDEEEEVMPKKKSAASVRGRRAAKVVDDDGDEE